MRGVTTWVKKYTMYSMFLSPSLPIGIKVQDLEELETREPLVVRGLCVVQIDRKPWTQILIQWCGQPLEDEHCVDLEEFQVNFPIYNLEDNVTFEGSTSDTALGKDVQLEPQAVLEQDESMQHMHSMASMVRA